MKILIFHGYLLRGTGSNIYNANLARALAGLGHEVHLLCQDREAGSLDWVNAVGTWPDAEGPESIGELQFEQIRQPGGEGSVTVYRPPIGKLLPVYVEDPYEGFEARAFPRLTDQEIDFYVGSNVAAVEAVERQIGGSDAALANHLIMGPVILARAGVRPYAVKNHGSDLEYTIKPNPRFIPWAAEGVESAAAVLVGSHHTAASMWEALPGLGLEEKTGFGPPGVDTQAFAPLKPGEHEGRIAALRNEIANEPPSTTFGRDADEAVAALDAFAAAEGPRVIFVGKLIVSKGVDLIVAAWPLIHRQNPGARLMLVGFGAYEMGLRALVTALTDGDIQSARDIAAIGRGLEGGEEEPLSYLTDFFSDLPAGYEEAGVQAAGSIAFAGRLDHDEVARVVPAADSMIVPSTFPEAFGMVAAEAAASGVLPVCAEHSGLAEVTATLAEEVPAVESMIGLPLGPGAVAELAGKVNRWLALDPAERLEIGQNIAESADRNWSWQGVAKDVISASAGQVRKVVQS
ncbi:MAG TPA: glycosyltransferase family 4 protein [Solirubrobacterales bacterium]|nr:glycosyltransferase family 4 protein [Solirubrobacterales bacterium]